MLAAGELGGAIPSFPDLGLPISLLVSAASAAFPPLFFPQSNLLEASREHLILVLLAWTKLDAVGSKVEGPGRWKKKQKDLNRLED